MEKEINFDPSVPSDAVLQNGFQALSLEHLQLQMFQWEIAIKNQPAIELQHKAKKNTRSFKFSVFAAASVIFVLIFSVRIFTSSPTIEGLYEQYYTPLPNYHQNRAVAPSDLSTALALYNTKNYKSAEKTLKTLLDKNQLSRAHKATALLYLAVCQMNNKKNMAASETFKEINRSYSDIYLEESLWYQSLNFLKLGEKEQSKDNLKKLKNLGASVYSKDAEKLLEEL
jgi:tetratricopeptide (TPR) repeat protein